MLKIKVKLPEMKHLLPERADLVEAVSVNAAERVMESVRDNFLRRGGKNFWREAADSVEIEYGGAGRSLVTIGQRGVRLQWLGGVVKPRAPRKLLAIPATEINHDINVTLNLNNPYLRRNRLAALTAWQEVMQHSSSTLEEELLHMHTPAKNGDLPPYCGIIIWYLKALLSEARAHDGEPPVA